MAAEKRICITGQRSTDKFNSILSVLIKEELLKGSVEFIFGDCSGVDFNAKEICNTLSVRYHVFPADWNKYGLSAGPIRNKQMIDSLRKNIDEVWAFHTDLDKSKGTKNTINLATKKGILVRTYK